MTEKQRNYKLKVIKFIQICINCNKAFWSTSNLFTKQLSELIKVAKGFTPEYRENLRLKIKLKKLRSLNTKTVEIKHTPEIKQTPYIII